MNQVLFKLKVPGSIEDPPAGFLFLCPLEDFKTSLSSVHWPDSPVFWSLDPSGVDRLSFEEATRLGFPLQFNTQISGYSLDGPRAEGEPERWREEGIDGILTSVNTLTGMNHIWILGLSIIHISVLSQRLGMNPLGRGERAPCTDHQKQPRARGQRPTWGGIHGNRWADGIKAFDKHTIGSDIS
jgi:hypothetical protein